MENQPGNNKGSKIIIPEDPVFVAKRNKVGGELARILEIISTGLARLHNVTIDVQIKTKITPGIELGKPDIVIPEVVTPKKLN